MSITLEEARARAAQISHAVPAADVLNHWQASVDAKQITWPELRALQADAMPRCACGNATVAYNGARPVCVDCFDAFDTAALMRRGAAAMDAHIEALAAECAQLDANTAALARADHLLRYWKRQRARLAGGQDGA